jgi:hypothetical protein
MKKKYKFISFSFSSKMRSVIIAMTAVCSLPAAAQDSHPFSHLNAALRTSTLGVGLEFATPLSKHFEVRAGLDYLGYNVPYNSFSLNDENGNMQAAFGYIPDLRMKEKLSLTHGHLLADFHPVAGGVFHLTAGAFVGTSRIYADGFLADGDYRPAELRSGYDWPTVNADGYEIDFAGGTSKADVYLGNTIKPYFGLGVGNAVTRHRVGVKFELGMLYQGDFKIKQDGHQIDSINDRGINDVKDINRYLDLLKWWPMLSLQLTCRLF